MHRYRVTKYDPAHRDATGAYLREEWTSFGDIGRVFCGVTLTRNEYLRVELAYLDAAMAFFEEDQSPTLRVVALEVRGDDPSVPADGAAVSRAELAELCRSILRRKFWCKLEGGGRYLHFGWDYYMYVGVVSECPQSVAQARSLGLFVEPFDSPHAADES